MEQAEQAGILRRNNVKVMGSEKQTMIFAHGFGCDHNMWRHVTPAFLDDFRVVLFDNVGAGGSDLSKFDRTKYSSLHGYAQDVREILRQSTQRKRSLSVTR
jgi:sigma-B regulation protein RsbQ